MIPDIYVMPLFMIPYNTISNFVSVRLVIHVNIDSCWKELSRLDHRGYCLICKVFFVFFFVPCGEGGGWLFILFRLFCCLTCCTDPFFSS
jgi:hypothetical protein